MMNYNAFTLDELKQGYRHDKEHDAYICNYCDKQFHLGEVFLIASRYYESDRAVAKHIDLEHNGNFFQLLNSETKYNTFTGIQRELLVYFQSGLSDKEISKKLGIAEATIRRQRFTFREKAKQAKLYLAVYEQVFDNFSPETDIIPVHNRPGFIDDRFLISEEERRHVLETNFKTLTPLVLKNFSRKEKKKVIILQKIVEQFEPGKRYSEQEINQILKPIYDDHVTIRRYLVMYGYLDRNKDGSSYWLTE